MEEREDGLQEKRRESRKQVPPFWFIGAAPYLSGEFTWPDEIDAT